MELGFWIQIVSGIPDSLKCIPESKAQYSGFHMQEFLGFQIPQARISRVPDSTSKNFPSSRFHKQESFGFQIPQDSGFLKQEFPGSQIPPAKISRIPDSTSKNFPDSRFHKQEFPGFRIPQAKISRIPDSTSKNFPDSLTWGEKTNKTKTNEPKRKEKN